MLVAHSVSPIHYAKTTVLILNPSLSPITVSKNENLGMAQPIDVKGVHVLEQSSHSNLKQNSQHIIQKMISKLPDIPSAQKELLRELLTEFQDVIDDGNNIGKTEITQHRINTGDAKPIRQPARRLPYHHREDVKTMIDDMLKKGVIEPSTGPWSSPIVLVKKMGPSDFASTFEN